MLTLASPIAPASMTAIKLVGLSFDVLAMTVTVRAVALLANGEQERQLDIIVRGSDGTEATMSNGWAAVTAPAPGHFLEAIAVPVADGYLQLIGLLTTVGAQGKDPSDATLVWCAEHGLLPAGAVG